MANYDQICFYKKSKLDNAMEANKLLHKKLSTACPDMHDQQFSVNPPKTHYNCKSA